ncbi:MAG: DUF86 domain-containing protein [Planctomycetes bacterium]|nr:DUF86 domain-containing protein [Planctomycetota bacterium]
MTRNLSLYLRDILENMTLAERFVGALTREEFVADLKTAYAVFRCLEVIGEAAKNVPPSDRDQYPAVPWRDMAGMRDRLIHFYFGVSFDKVWRAVKDNIPVLKPIIEQALRNLDAQ